jgi:sugar/nucleoside kinase (ribokinase family)
MAPDASDIAVVGHFSIDNISLPSRKAPYKILGGAVAFVSLAACNLDASASVISKVGGDFPESYISQLQKAGVDTSGIIRMPNEQTTSFELTYNQDLSSRSLRLRNQGSPITQGDLPDSLLAKVIHIAPIAGEIAYDVVKSLKKRCSCLSIDPQGMTRRFDQNGNVTASAQMDKRVLSLINIYKSSLDEIQTLTGQSELEKAVDAVHDLGPETVIITMGAKGSVLSTEGEISQVAIYESEQVVDPTGAGDVFIAAYLVEHFRGKDPFWCACVGSAAASMVVEGMGTIFFGEKAEIYRRADVVYEKEIKP